MIRGDNVDIHKINLIPYGSMTSFPDSQTIFGSICWSIRELYGEDELEKLLDNFKNHENRFVVSSSFREGVLKAPMMVWATLDEIIEIGDKVGIKGSQLSTKSKLLKKIEYLSEGVFKSYLKGELDRKEVVKDLILEEGKYEFSEGILRYKDEKLPCLDYREENDRRNFINRLSGTTDEGQLFYYKRTFVPANSNLYFLIKVNNIDYFLPIFKYMSDIAIGGDRSIGVNAFEVSYEGQYDCVKDKNIDESILLSKYIPYYEEVDWDNSYFSIAMGRYKVESRHEFFGEDIFKKQVGYLEEGSKIFLKEDKDIYGRLPVVKVINNKKIRHNGLGFFL